VPLYEYECSKCRHRFELLQKFSDEPVTACPRCGATANRLLSSSAFQFKGTGWYVTDYGRKSSPAAEEKKEGKEESAGDKTPATPVESKESKEPPSPSTNKPPAK
jgi:putative FmdB family regulatory protein